MRRENKRVVITGAFGTLGAAVAKAALAAGAKVAAVDRADASPSGVDLGAAQRFGGIDLADAAQAKTAIDAAAQSLGGLDALVNIAGAFRWETIADGKPETWDLLYRINLRTVVAASQAALAHLRAGGRIVKSARIPH